MPRGGADVDAEVERALALFDQIDALAADGAARGALRQMFRRLNLNLWLSFGEGRKGKRAVRVLTGGLITRATRLPRRPYGEETDDDGDRPSTGGVTGGALPPVGDANEASPVGVDRAEDVSFCRGRCRSSHPR